MTITNFNFLLIKLGFVGHKVGVGQRVSDRQQRRQLDVDQRRAAVGRAAGAGADEEGSFSGKVIRISDERSRFEGRGKIQSGFGDAVA